MAAIPGTSTRAPRRVRRGARSATGRVLALSIGPDALLGHLADRPYPVLAGFLGTTLVAADPVEVIGGDDTWGVLETPARPGGGTLAGSWLGYVGYAVRSGVAYPDAGPMDAILCRYATVAQFWPDGHCVVWGDGPAARELCGLAREFVRVAAPVPVPTSAAVETSLDPAAYRAAVASITDRITAGDCSQVNLVQRLEARWDGGPLALAERMWAAAGPAPHRGYLAAPGGALISASPERLVAVDDGIAISSPIKGTAPRGSGAALAASVKDRAEHVMIVDLVRNDLGRVAVSGQVWVPRLMVPLTTGYAEHLVSDVAAILRPSTTVSEILSALFPAGSITGCPKIAAMEIIDLLEPVGRGPAFGSMVAATPDGRCEATVLIRTAWLEKGRAWYWSGGGVTWDSDPAAEHAEAMIKARPFLEAVGCV
jgi:para-aminobenzoate synthetase/4-amino-4-deoxychorismate lyase